MGRFEAHAGALLAAREARDVRVVRRHRDEPRGVPVQELLAKESTSRQRSGMRTVSDSVHVRISMCLAGAGSC